MRRDSIPESLDSVLQEFRSCFTRTTFGNFTHLVVGWIVCRGRRWITRVLAAGAVVCHKHHSRFYRFFSSARWDSDTVGLCLFRLLLPHLPDTIEAIVDDTLCRRSGPRIFGISMHHDGAASSYGHGVLACGHSWVVLAVRLPLPWKSAGMAVPVLVRLYRSPKRCSTREYRKRTELARELIEILARWLPEDRVLHLTGDREYACKTLLRDLDPKVQFTGPMPMNAMLFGPVPKYRGIGRPRVRGQRLRSPKARGQRSRRSWERLELTIYGRTVKLRVMSWTCLWYTATGQRLVRVVVTRDPKGNFEDRAFFSTDVVATPAQLLERYSHRWLIEVSFRDAKQHFGLNDPQNGWSRGRIKSKQKPGPQPRGNRGRRTVERTVPFIWTLYGIVTVWYLREDRWKDDVMELRKRSPWYSSKTTPSFQDMVEALRVETLAHRLLARPLRTRTLAETRKVVLCLAGAA